MDEKKKGLEIYFNYRALTDDETKKYGTQNTQEMLTSSVLSRISSEISEKGGVREFGRNDPLKEVIINLLGTVITI